MPSIQASATYQPLSDLHVQDAQTTSSDHASIGVTVRVPIFTGLSTVSSVEAQKQQYVQATQQLEATHRSVLQMVRSAFYGVRAALSQYQAQQQALVSAQSKLQSNTSGL